MSLVLLILSLLGSGLVSSLAAQGEAQRRRDAQDQLTLYRELILGFSLANGRLPCPAPPALAEGDPLAGVEDCTRQHGVLPWVTLSAAQLDPWGRRLTYFASDRFTGPPATAGGAGFGLDTVGNANVLDSLGKTLASGLPVLFFSHGPNGLGAYLADGGRFGVASGPEAENADADLTFVQAAPGSLTQDDLLAWISSEQLKARLVSAGRLP